MSKPATKPRWATDPGAIITVPAIGAQDTGLVPNIALGADLVNWQWNLTASWIDWFDDAADRAFNQAASALVDVTTVSTGAPSNGFAVNGSDVIAGSSYVFYAVGNSGAINVSKDGRTWASGTAGSSYAGAFAGVTYDVGRMLAYGASGEIQECTAGSNTWSRLKTGGSRIVALASDGSAVAVAVDSSGHVWTADAGVGTLWTDRSALLSAPKDVCAADLGGTIYFCAADGAAVKRSSNGGITWTSTTVESGCTVNRVGYSAALGLLFAAGKDSGGYGGIWSSPDGATWTRKFTHILTYELEFLTVIPYGVVAGGSGSAVGQIVYDGVAETAAYMQITPGAAPAADGTSHDPISYCYCPARNLAMAFVSDTTGGDLYRSRAFVPLRAGA